MGVESLENALDYLSGLDVGAIELGCGGNPGDDHLPREEYLEAVVSALRMVGYDGAFSIDHWWPPGHVIGWEHAFAHENYEFLSAVASGDDYHPTFADGLAIQRVLAAIEESDERRERVRIDAA